MPPRTTEDKVLCGQIFYPLIFCCLFRTFCTPCHAVPPSQYPPTAESRVPSHPPTHGFYQPPELSDDLDKKTHLPVLPPRAAENWLRNLFL